jgi:hypothetical protein
LHHNDVQYCRYRQPGVHEFGLELQFYPGLPASSPAFRPLGTAFPDLGAGEDHRADLARANGSTWSQGSAEWAMPAAPNLTKAIAGPGDLKRCSNRHSDSKRAAMGLQADYGCLHDATNAIEPQLAMAALSLANRLNTLWP